MKISEICIRRPVFAWVMTFILILLGVVSFNRLAVQKYPSVEQSYITIESTLNGASPEVVEAQVTRVIEDAISGLEGIKEITSSSGVEESKVSIEFSPGRRVEDAANDIRDRLSKFKDRLPHEMNDPTLIKSRSDDRAIVTLALTSDTLDSSELADYAMREIQKDLESINGIARVDVLGAGVYKMRLKLDPVKMASVNITVADVMQAIKQQNIEKPAGKLISNEREYLVTTVASIETAEEFDRLPIANREGRIILLRDLGGAELSADDRKTRTRFNGKTGVSIGVVKQATSNPIEVAHSVKKLLPKIEERLPQQMKLHVASDQTRYIEESIFHVYKTIFESTFLVILVVFAFLRSLRASIIPLVTIPVSLIGVVFFMYLLGFSINILTLMAMVLAIGLVVDDAIVVLENIYRYIEEGMKPYEAAVKGVREISFAIIAMTLTLVAVYAPIALVKGVIGKYFTEFAITLAGAVLISGFAALTLTPMMCARLLGNEQTSIVPKSATWWLRFKDSFRSDLWLDRVEAFYEAYLSQLLVNPLRLVGSAFILAFLGAATYYMLPRELFPNEDQGMIFIEGQAAQAATIDFTDKYIQQLDQILAEVPEIERRITQINNPTYDVSIQLRSDRVRSTKEIEKDLKVKLSDITGLTVNFKGSGGGYDQSDIVEFVVGGNKTHSELKNIDRAIGLGLYQSPLIVGVKSNRQPDTEDYTVTIKRDKASSLGIDPGAIADTIDALVRGRKSSSFKRDNKLFDVMVEVIDQARQTPNDITNLFMKANDKKGSLVPLAELVEVNSRSGPTSIFHHNRVRAVSNTAILKPRTGQQAGIDLVSSVAKERLPAETRFEFTGETRKFIEESSNLFMIFAMALIFIYLVMAAQFESWIDPFIIILTVPLSLAGAVITLRLIDNGTMNVYSMIGLVTLIGLITKHGILIVDVANKKRDDGMAKLEAVISASIIRLRPILMTTFAMVLGAVPLALVGGAGFEARRQIGWVIVGGMSIGTLFTLFVLPAVYLLLSREKRQSVTQLIEV